jgi:hypothetical protein
MSTITRKSPPRKIDTAVDCNLSSIKAVGRNQSPDLEKEASSIVQGRSSHRGELIGIGGMRTSF